MRPPVLMLSQEVHPIPPTKGAAVEQWIDAVAHRMTRYQAYVVSVPHPTRPDREFDGDVHYHRIRIGRVYNRVFRKLTRLDPYSYIDRVTRYARSIRPAIVHIHNAPRFVLPVVQGVPGAKVILHMHNEKDDEIGARVAALVGCSDYICDWYRQRQVLADRFITLANGVDIAAYAPTRATEEQRRGLRAEFGVPADRFVVLYAGRISPEKGADCLVDALRVLEKDRFHLVLLGEWPSGDPATSKRVRFSLELAERLRDVPHTVLGSVLPNEMGRLYGLADLLVIPSRFEEPFSMVAIEAMAAHVPVMALRKGGMTEYMKDGENAFLVDGEASAEELGNAIRKASESQLQRDWQAKVAREMVAARFDWRHIANDVERLYDQVLA